MRVRTNDVVNMLVRAYRDALESDDGFVESELERHIASLTGAIVVEDNEIFLDDKILTPDQLSYVRVPRID